MSRLHIRRRDPVTPPRPARAGLLLALLLPVLPAPALAGGAWVKVASEDGVTVWKQEKGAGGFPTFRGVGLVKANIFQVMAVLSDVDRHTQWMEACIDARMLRQISEYERIVYSRTDAPWPVSDRDAVFYSKAHVDMKRKVVDVRFKAVRSRLKPPVDGVVRMHWLRGHYKFTYKDENLTLVDYKVDADPGGMLPTWLAKLATRRLPLNTIKAFRTRCKKTAGWYDKRIEKWKRMARELAGE